MGWTSPLVLAGFVIAPLALLAFVLTERRAPQPLLPLHYFGRRNFTFPIIVQALMNAAYMGSFVLTPLLLQNLLGYNEGKTALVSIARPLAFSLAGPLAGYVAVRIGERVSAMASPSPASPWAWRRRRWHRASRTRATRVTSGWPARRSR